MNDMENMRVFADQLWKYMVPKLNAMFSSNVSYFRAQVVSNPGNNMLEVQRPVENGTLTLPCTNAMSGAQAGHQVVALVMGSMSNAIVVGDGKLNPPLSTFGPSGIVAFEAGKGGLPILSCKSSTAGTIYRTGKNMVDQKQYTSSSVTWNGDIATWTVASGTNYAMLRVPAIRLLAGVTYTVSCYINAIEKDPSYAPRIVFRTTSWVIAKQAVMDASAMYGFLSCSYTPTTDTTMYVGIMGTGSPGGGCKFEVSQFQLEVGTERSDFSPYQGGSWTYDPETETLTPPVMSSVPGINYIWADTGDVTVEYGDFLRAIQKEIENLN